MVLFDFAAGADQDVRGWQAVGDRVMGGVSSGRMVLDPGGFAVFEGEVSTAFGGGFASVRTSPRPTPLSDFDGIELCVRGDGRGYKLHLRCDPRFDAVLHTARFEPSPARFADWRFRWSAFQPTFRGRAVPDAAPLDPARVVGFGLMTDGRRAGAFRLEIARITAFSETGA